MAKLSADLIVTQRHRRNFIQFGGPRPLNRVQYAGQDSQYMSIQGVTLHDTGGIDPVYVPDPRVQGAYQLVNRSRTAPDLPEASLVLHESHGSIPFQLFRLNCAFTLYEAVGVCKALEDPNNGWSDYLFVYSNCLVTDKDLGDRSSWDADEAAEDTLSMTLAGAYPIGSLNFGNKAAAQVTLEVKDIVYGTQIQCGDCGVPNDGTNFIYAIQDANASPGAKPSVVYSVDGGLTWTAITITTAATAEVCSAIDIVGDKLVVLSPAGGTGASALYYSQINAITGVPSSTFTKVNLATATTAHQANDMYVGSPSEIYFCGNAGYIFKSSDITGDVSTIDAGSATSSNLARIHGSGDVVVAVGATGAVVKTLNRGATWAVTTTNPGSGTSTAIQVMDTLRYWYGNASGSVYYTVDGGETWTTRALGITPTSISDIVVATDEVIHVLIVESATLKLVTTMNGGYSWVNTSQITPRMQGWPGTGVSGGRMAVPSATNDLAVAANNVAVGGLGSTPDGVIFLGVSARK